MKCTSCEGISEKKKSGPQGKMCMYYIYIKKMPTSPSSLLQNVETSNWNTKLASKDAQENNIKLIRERENKHWEAKFGPKKWSTINDLHEVLFRIHCLLKAGISADEILVSFDFDGTLGARRSMKSMFLQKDNPVSHQDTYDQEMKSVQVLDKLNKLKIPYFVNIANDNPCRAMESMHEHRYEIGHDTKVEKQRSSMPISTILIEKHMENIGIEKAFSFHGKNLRQCGHVLSAGYDKHVPIDYVITNFNLSTKVIIHVDDGPINIQTVMERGFDQCVIGLYFPTIGATSFVKEPNEDEALDYMYENAARQCDA